jgi:hypothetical protein
VPWSLFVLSEKFASSLMGPRKPGRVCGPYPTRSDRQPWRSGGSSRGGDGLVAFFRDPCMPLVEAFRTCAALSPSNCQRLPSGARMPFALISRQEAGRSLNQ